MRFSDVFIVFPIISITRDANGIFNLDIIKEFIAPTKPEVNRVRRMEDANGDPLAVLDTGLILAWRSSWYPHNISVLSRTQYIGSTKHVIAVPVPAIVLDPELYSVGLVERYGYPAEQHNVTTEDGYSIVFFRIPGSPKSPPTTGKPMVFMQHGLFLSSDSWVLMGPNNLAFLLADTGYDVWIGNVRGNTYARSHKKLTTLDKEFWNFSFDEMGSIDTPSLIDYGLEYTGQKTFFYIGHSMGTVISYAILTERPEYNDKMRLVVSLAPAAFWKYDVGPAIQLLAQNSALLETLADALGIYNFFPQSKTTAELVRILSADNSPVRDVVLSLYHLIDGQAAPGFNNSALPSMFLYFPAGASRKTVSHFLQNIITGATSNKKFDYGTAKNLMIYGTREPPIYNVSKISAPVALFYGQSDGLVQARNVIGLSKLFSNLVTCEAVPSPVFSHGDFIWSLQAKNLLYSRIIDLLSKYSK